MTLNQTVNKCVVTSSEDRDMYIDVDLYVLYLVIFLSIRRTDNVTPEAPFGANCEAIVRKTFLLSMEIAIICFYMNK